MKERLERLTSDAFVQFVKANENVDVNRFLLGSAPENIDKKEAVDQILSRRKAKDKLPDWYSRENLVFPPPLSIEQSSSQQAANYKKNILKGDQLVDLTGGMGVDVVTLSEQFSKSTHVEIDPWLSFIFAHNAERLSKNSIQAINQSAEEFLADFKGKATFFIDPARRDSSKRKVFLFEDCSPNVIELLPTFKKKAEAVLIKAAPMIDISLGIKELEYVKEVHVVSVVNECKEVLFLLDFTIVGTPKIHCVNLHQDQLDLFSFDFEQEKETLVHLGDAKKYLYEPNASIRKAGAFKSIAAYYAVEKIAVNTHLYTSDKLISDFPGRIFEVQNEATKKNIKSLLPEGKANVISKNYPLTADQIKKKFGLKDGGNSFLIGFRDMSNAAKLILTHRINTFQSETKA